MIKIIAPSNRLHHLVAAALLTLIAAAGCAADKSAPASITPAPRTVEYSWMSVARWHELFADDVEVARRADVILLVVGEAITEGWPASPCDKYFAPYKAANLGIGGDQLGNLL